VTTVRRLVRRALLALLVLLVAGVAYLSLAPVPLEPEVWRPPPARAWPGNDRLAGAAVLHGDLAGPEAIAFDAGGRVVTGLLDGRIVRFAADGASGAELLAITGGRPLGLAYDAAGRLIVADARRGLLALARDGALATLATAHAGVPFRFTDDLAIARDGTIYFTDASSRFGFAAFKLDILDHRPRGRLLAYHPATGETSLVLGDLYFANGVALGPDDAYLLVAETASYRIRRVWLRGARAGQAETFADDLPGFPDNVSYAPARRAFWVAIGSPRDAVVDALAPHPFLRKVVARLPEALQPAAKRHAWVLALDEHGRVVADLQRAGPDAYAPVSSVVERDGWLYLGSFAHAGVARARAP
jgi:sugar lactone lactonase YvrE